ncbi:MAG: hypothetical protein FGM14_04645 [Flavobacteriales bacterium]|nr:hypothetical protein [Flavobacteriales bacterium]
MILNLELIWLTILQLEEQINNGFKTHSSFCYETNFDHSPLFWAKQAKDFGYFLELHFYCLETIEIAKNRVEIRTKNQDHPFSEEIIKYKWKLGYKNLNINYQFFDLVYLIDNSFDGKPPKVFLEIEKEIDESFLIKQYVDLLPTYAESRIPSIFNFITN